MKYLILDTWIVLQNPGALGVTLPTYQIVILDIVVRQIEMIASKRRDAALLPALIRESAEKRIIQIDRTPSGSAGELEGTSPVAFDALIFQYLKQLREREVEFAFVTTDQDLIVLCAAAGIPLLGQTEFAFLLSRPQASDSAVRAKAGSIRRSQWVHYGITILLGVGSSTVASFLFPYLQRAFASINIWGTLAALFCCGIAAYVFRARKRLLYGVFEFTFGFIFAARVFWPQFDYAALTPTDYLQILAGVYVMVRGLDNVQKGSRGTVAESLLERIAPSG